MVDTERGQYRIWPLKWPVESRAFWGRLRRVKQRCFQVFVLHRPLPATRSGSISPLKTPDFGGLQTPGEVVHTEWNPSQLVVELQGQNDDQAAKRILENGLYGAATIGEMASPPSKIKAFRNFNSKILRSRGDASGLDHGISFQQQWNYATLAEAVYAHSPVLTLAHLKSAEKTTVHSGARCLVLIHTNYTSKGYCTQFHTSLVVLPNDARDGEPWLSETEFNFKFMAKADSEYLDEIFGHYKTRFIRDPTNTFEKLHAGAPIDERLGRQNTVSAVPLSHRHMLAFNMNAKVFGFDKPGRIMFPTQGIMEFDVSPAAHQRLASMRSLIQAANSMGSIATTGAHCGGNNCFNWITRLVLEEEEQLRLINQPLHVVNEALADAARQIHWTDDLMLDVFDYLSHPDKFPIVDKTTLVNEMNSLLDHPTIKNGHGGETAFATQYCLTDARHPDKDAAKVYDIATNVALQLLESRAKNIGK